MTKQCKRVSTEPCLRTTSAFCKETELKRQVSALTNRTLFWLTDLLTKSDHKTSHLYSGFWGFGAETFISPDHAAAVGMSYDDMLSGCVEGINDAERDFGIVGRLIVSCIRHLGPEQAVVVAQQLADNPHPYIVGFGMGGNESMFTQADFAPAFNIAAAAGLACTTHAGEILGPESVWDAIDNLPVTRIGHGVRSVEDPALMAELVKRGIALEVCPGSNIALSVYPDLASHPLNTILQAGISTSLNADDPPFFATTIGAEYQSGAKDFGLDLEQLRNISRMAMQASFADADTKARLLAVIG